MTKSELAFFDTIYLGPILLLVNQYFGYLITEYYLLWFGLVSEYLLFLIFPILTNMFFLLSP